MLDGIGLKQDEDFKSIYLDRAGDGKKLPQACETTAAKTVAATIKPELIHPGVMKYFRETGVAK